MIDRHKPGQIRDAILTFLQECRREASLGEIKDAVTTWFGDRVPASSVRSYLRLNTPELFVRVKPGWYRLTDGQTDSQSNSNPLHPVFTYGRSSLYHADCRQWLRQQPEQSIQAIVTDPPYGFVEYSPQEQRKLREGKGGIWRIPPSFDGHERSPLPRFTVLRKEDFQKIRVFFYIWAREVLRVLVPGAHVIMASNTLVSYVVATALAEAGLERRGEIARMVMTMRGGDRPKNAHAEFAEISVMTRSMWEPWLIFRKPLEGRAQDNLRKWKTGGFRRPSLDKPFGDLIASHPARGKERAAAAHPTLKPQSFLRQIVRAVLPLAEGVVVDPFAGSGSTLAAAEAVGYQSIGIEVDEFYVDMAVKAIPRLAALDAPNRVDRPSLF